jgi:hypothetical protein
MATLIGLSLRVKLLRSLPRRFKVQVSITPGTHVQEHQGSLTIFSVVLCEFSRVTISCCTVEAISLVAFLFFSHFR